MTTPSPARWRELGATYQHRGHEIFVAEGGSGERNLLCLHGFPTSSWDWAPLWDDLTGRFRVLAPDFVGFGFSAKPRRYDYSMNDQADLVDGLVRDRGIGTADVLAHDIGDTVTQELLARQLDGRLGFEIRTVTLLNGGLFPETHRPILIQKLLLSPVGPAVSLLVNEPAFARSLREVLAVDAAKDDQLMRQLWAIASVNGGTRITHRLIRYIDDRRRSRDRWVGALQEATTPVRLVAGLEDPVSGAHMVERYRELIPEPDVVELDGVGHYPQFEAPQRTLEAFLSGPVAET